MQINGKKNNFPRNFLFNEKFLTVFLLAIIILLSIPLYNNYHRRQKISKEISDLENEIRVAENKDTDLQKLIKYLESDQFVEEQARLNLNMKKPGESVAVVNDSSDKDKNDDTKLVLSPVIQGVGGFNLGYSENWLKYFFKNN
jgi:cell division protein FtsL